MKLVDILARELKLWPEGVYTITQQDNGYLYDEGNYPLDISVSLSEDLDDVVTYTAFAFALKALEESPALHLQQVGRIHRVVTWDGDGLPPVGLVCEGHVKNGGDWGKYKVIATSNDYMIVFDEESGETPIRHIYWEFRPIRTTEQIAAEERSLAVADMVKSCPYPGAACTVTACAALYDAGYRKKPK